MTVNTKTAGRRFTYDRSKQALTNRKIHLDFHTPHWVKQVAQDYDPEALVRTWKQAHINAVNRCVRVVRLRQRLLRFRSGARASGTGA